jgi:hypothetical protein
MNSDEHCFKATTLTSYCKNARNDWSIDKPRAPSEITNAAIVNLKSISLELLSDPLVEEVVLLASILSMKLSKK